MSTVLECGICVTYDEKATSTISEGDYGSVLFFPCHGFCPNGFSHDQVFNEALRNTGWIIKGECYKISVSLDNDYPLDILYY